MRSGPLLSGVVLGLLATSAAAGQSMYRESAEAQAGFGRSVAVSGGTVFIGEPQNQVIPGVVYLYARGARGWTEQARLMASDAAPGDFFGAALAVDGTTLAVSALQADSGRGAVYVFTRTRAGRWEQAARLTAGTAPGDGLGMALALQGDLLLAGAPSADSLTGAVYVFRRGSTGAWAAAGRVGAEDLSRGDRFGTAVAMDQGVMLVGAPRQGEQAGTVYAYRWDGGTGAWAQEAKLKGRRVERNHWFGAALALRQGTALVGAPRFTASGGAVFSFTRTEAGEWREGFGLLPFDPGQNSQFGAAIAQAGDDIWVGAPGADRFTGRMYVFRRAADSTWAGAWKLASPAVERGDFFAASAAVAGNVAVVGNVNDDYGAGTALIFERDARGDWKEAGKVLSEDVRLPAITGGNVRCDRDSAGGFGCRDVDLLAFLPVNQIGGARGVRMNDVWGWTDAQTGREYVIAGRMDGTAFVDVTDPSRPVYLGNLPKTAASPGSTWRDMKVYKDHVFIVADGAGEHGMQVFDLRQLRAVRNAPVTFTETVHYDRIASAHNIVINEETGFAYTVGNSSGGETCGGGLHMIDIREPTRPTFVGCFQDKQTGRASTGYSHDAQCVIYHGPDEQYRGREICIGANETAISISDVTDKANPVAISRASYPNVGYAHQGWFTEDHRYWLLDDEGDELAGTLPGTRTLIWDLADLDDPVLFKEFFGATRASDHNLYVKGNLVFQSNYQAGLRVLDISDMNNPKEVAYFDTVPYGENTPGFGGSWSNYPFFRSGTVAVTSGSEGLFIVKKREAPVP